MISHSDNTLEKWKMKRILIAAAAIAMTSVAHAQLAFTPPVAVPVQGAHCDAGVGPVPLMAYDTNGHPMQCANTDKNGAGSWQYVAESDVDRITHKLNQINATESQILVKLTELVAAQQASAHAEKNPGSQPAAKASLPIPRMVAEPKSTCDMDGLLAISIDGQSLTCKSHKWEATVS